MPIADYLDPQHCPKERPDLAEMTPQTQALHTAIDAAMRASGQPYLHPDGPTVQLDLLGSARMRDWQEGKVAFLWEGEGCWSELPQVYARYGTEATRALLRRVQALEHASCVLLTDCGMQASALLFDTLVQPGSHAIILRQTYNKTRTYLKWLAARVGASVTVVDDGDMAQLEAAVRPETVLVFAETYTNPLMRALDPEALGAAAQRWRLAGASGLRLVIDHTIATPWGLKRPLLDVPGIDFVVTAGTKALGGQDRDLWGYIASNRSEAMNLAMDLQAMRGGILDWRRAETLLAGLDEAEARFRQRCATAGALAAFLAQHPRVEAVFHPSLVEHPDHDAIERSYALPGSLMSFRLRGASEDEARHFCDVLATCEVPRYALSFDGLTTKVNHHKTVSEYFTPDAELQRAGIDRLVRLGVGTEAAPDLIACLNWALWQHDRVTPAEIQAWQAQRARDLRIYASET